MNAQAQPTKPAKATRERAFLRSYDYANGVGTVKDAESGQAIQTINVHDLPESVKTALMLSAAMEFVAGPMVEAHRDGEDAAAAGASAYAELVEGQAEFREGSGISMGGTLKKVARVLVDMGYTKAKGPDGVFLHWSAGSIPEAFAAMKALWAIPENKEKGTISGRTLFNRIKSTPEVTARLAALAKKPSGVELG